MLFTNLQLNSRTLKIISLLLTITGIIFIMFSNHIGIILVRIAILAAIVYCVISLKTQYEYLKAKEKTTYLIIVLALLIGFYNTNLLMIITGSLLMYLSIPQYYKMVKSKDYSDIVTIIVHGISLSFSIYCFLNANAALNTVIIIVGIILTITGCISLYEFLMNSSKKSNSENNESKRFEDTSSM